MGLKLLHTSDWHLGKKLYKQCRMDEHRLFLNWLIETIESEKVDVLLVSGDIFDGPNPPAEAIKLYYSFLAKLDQLGTNSFFIAGNHDSKTLIEVPAELMPNSKIKFVGKLTENPQDINYSVQDKSGDNYSFFCLPYFRNYELYNLKQKYNIEVEDDQLLTKLLGRYVQEAIENDNAVKRVMLAHHLFGIHECAGSEQSISLSGVDHIPLELFKNDFDYLALGHIHKPQVISNSTPKAVYSGSPLKLRFSEIEKKSVCLINIDTQDTKLDKFDIPEFRIMRTISINEENYISKLENFAKEMSSLATLNAFIEININSDFLNSVPIDEIKAKARELNLDILNIQNSPIKLNKDKKEDSKYTNINSFSSDILFEQFYKNKYPNSEIPTELKTEFLKLLEIARSPKQIEEEVELWIEKQKTTISNNNEAQISL